MEINKSYLNLLKVNLGVDLLGIADPKELLRLRKEIQVHKERGYSSSFEEEDPARMVEAKTFLDNPKSIFVIGMSYLWDCDDKLGYKVSNHARGLDYHRVVRGRLEALVELLRKDHNFQYYLQVDTGSLYEKELARLAGFGYLGKNTLLINPQYGSYIFLGILVTDLEVTMYSKATAGTCGSCKQCVLACPSQAIRGDYLLDSTRCHSYLSQSKITIDETKNLSFCYGCDICQEVCPKNREVLKNIHLDFKPKLYGLREEDLEGLSNKEFKNVYGDYSFSWVGKKILLRNIKSIRDRK